MRRRWLAFLLPWLVLILFPLAAGTQPAAASNAVVQSPCGEAEFDTALAAVQNSGGGTVTFSCTVPAEITLLGTKFITSSVRFEGADNITLNGFSDHRLFVVEGGARLTLNRMTLTACRPASGDGGAIQNSGTLLIDHSTFRDNATGSSFSGGAILSTGDLTVTNSLFEFNQGGNAGAIYPRFTSSRTYIRDTVFRHNHALNISSGWGGAMLLWDGAAVTIDGGEFYSNTARDGGAIYNTNLVYASSLLVTDTVFRDNRAGNQFGGAVYNAGLFEMTGGVMSGNFAGDSGGAAYITGTAELSGTTLSGNQAFRGGALYVDLAYVNLTNLALEGNIASNNGGGIYSQGNLSLSNIVVRANQAASGGGGLYLNYPGSPIWGTTFLDRVTASANAAQDGGGLYLFGALLSMTDSTVSQNYAARGAGVTANSATLIVQRSALWGNQASSYGGALALNFSNTALENVTLSGNSADSGGALRTFSTGPTSLRNVTISSNTANIGAGLHILAGTQPITLTNVILADNPLGGNCNGTVSSANYSLSSDLTCALPGAGNHTHTPALLTGLGNYGGPTKAHMLKAGSPAIDGVIFNDAPSVDQRNLHRPQGDGFDIGAIERQPDDVELIPWALLPLVRR